MYWFNGLFSAISLDSKLTNRKLAKFKNNYEFQNTFARCITDALHRYTIEGLPETCSERVILQALLYYGCVVFFERNGSVLALPGGGSEDYNIYGDPRYAWVYGRNGYNEHIRLFVPGADDDHFLDKGMTTVSGGTPKGVLIRENAIAYPFVNYVIEYAQAISDSMRTLDVCRQNIKQPYIIVAEEAIIPSVKEFFKQRNENLEYIISSGVFPADKINLLPFESNADNLKNATDMVEWYWNQWRELCGLKSNSNPDKKERLLVDEVNAAQESTDAQVDKCIKYIQEGLDLCNDVFGTSMEVKQTGSETENETGFSLMYEDEEEKEEEE